MDFVLGGGVPLGNFVVLNGHPKCGKTVSLLHLGGKAQAMGCPVYYFDIEARLKPRDLLGIECLNPKEMKWIKSTKKKMLAAHEWLKMAREIVCGVPKAFIILDSISALCDAGRYGIELNEKKRAPEASVVANFIRENGAAVSVNDCVVCCVTHRVANVGNTYGGMSETGGTKIGYALSIRMQAIKTEFFPKESDEPLGQKVLWTTSSTAIAGPGRKAESYIRYGIGIDEVAELIDAAVRMRLITKKGSWYTCDFNDKKPQAQGQIKLWDLITGNPELLKELDEKVREILIG
jgi:recombination protein RecA